MLSTYFDCSSYCSCIYFLVFLLTTLRVCRLVFHFFWFTSFSVVLFYWLFSTVAAISIRHIVCNPLITGVIRDVMFTFIAYVIKLISITAIVSNLHIYNLMTTFVFGTRSFSDDGILHTQTRITTLTWSGMNGTIFHLIACHFTVTRSIIDSTIYYIVASLFTVTRAITDIDVVCVWTSNLSLYKREVEYETARRKRQLWDDNTNKLHANTNI